MNPKEMAKRQGFLKTIEEWVAANCPDWTEEPVIVDWFASAKSKETLRNWRSQFCKFIGYVQMTPTQMFDKRRTDRDSKDPKVEFFFEDRIVEYAHALTENHYTEWTRKSYISRVQAFFSHHRMKLSFKQGELKFKETAAAKTMRRSKRFAKRAAASINMDMRLMYNVANPEDRVILMLAYQYGFLPADISKVKIDDLPLDDEGDFIYWETQRSKTGEDVWTALNPEIVNDLKALRNIRTYEVEGMLGRKTIDEDPGWLFITNRGGRLREERITQRLKALAAQSLDDERVADFSAKDLRDCFNVSLLEAELSPEVKDKLYGHKLEGSRGHYMISPKAIIEGYEKVFRIVSLDGWKQTRRDDRESMEFLKMALGIILKTNPEAIEAIEKMAQKEPGYTYELLKMQKLITSLAKLD